MLEVTTGVTVVRLLVGLSALFLSLSVQSSTISFDLLGNATLRTGLFTDEPALVTGSFTYDTSWPKRGNVFIAADGTQFGMSFDVGSLSFSSTDFFGASEHDIAVHNNNDLFTYTASDLGLLPTGARFTVELFDDDGDALKGDQFPITLDLQKFDVHAIGILWLARSVGNGEVTDKLDFDITSLTLVAPPEPTSTPEPATVILLAIGIAGIGIRRAGAGATKRTEKSRVSVPIGIT